MSSTHPAAGPRIQTNGHPPLTHSHQPSPAFIPPPALTTAPPQGSALPTHYSHPPPPPGTFIFFFFSLVRSTVVCGEVGPKLDHHGPVWFTLNSPLKNHRGNFFLDF